MTRGEADRILELARTLGALVFGDFLLSSGQRSSYYFDGRLLTLNPEGSYLVSRALLPVIYQYGAEAVGGPTLGADPMVGALILTSHLEQRPVRGFLVRKATKEHGTARLIEGGLANRAGDGSPIQVAIVDDTCSTGGNLISAIEAVESIGCKVVCVATVLDRQQGGSEDIRKRGYPFHSILVADSAGSITPSLE